MALQKITYADKVALQENATIADVNKINASDMNEIKTVFNAMADAFGTLPKVVNNLTSTSTTDALSAYQGKLLLDRLVANYYDKTVADSLLSNKVDKVSGKQLSTEDYTTAEKNKLSTVEENANNYILPNADSTVVGGLKVRLDGSTLYITNDGTNP